MIVPLVGSTVFAVGSVSTRQAEARQAETVELLAELSVHAGDLLHETQKERGSTALYLSSGGTQFVDELPAQQSLTDSPRATFVAFVDQHRSELPETVLDSLGPALDDLASIDVQRARAIELDGDLGEFVGWYTTMNAHLLAAIAEMAAESPNSELAIDSTAYVAFLNAKERAGLERAQLSAAFAADAFRPGQLSTVVSLVSAQTSFLSLFESLAAPEVLEFHQARQAEPAVEETARLERLAIDNGVGDFGVDAGEWFATITGRIDGLKATEDFQADRILTGAGQLASDARSSALAGMVSSVALLLVSLLIGGLTIVGLARELRSISQSARRIADGELSIEPLEVGARDDMGRLREAFNDMTVSLNQMVDGLRRSSGSLNDSSGELVEVYQRVSATADDAAERVVSAASATEELSQTMNSVATSIDEIQQAIAEITSSAQQASTGTSEAVYLVEQTVATIGDLGTSSSEVGSVIEMINEIAEQTNLLALNATIEAARAGEEGKGFAVVANEVKTLATRTSEATTEITDRIEVIQAAVGRAVEGNDQVSDIIGQIDEATGSIAAAVEEQSVAMGEITKSIEHTATATAQISTSIDHVATGASESRRITHESCAMAEQMGDLASDLDELVGAYR